MKANFLDFMKVFKLIVPLFLLSCLYFFVWVLPLGRLSESFAFIGPILQITTIIPIPMFYVGTLLRKFALKVKPLSAFISSLIVALCFTILFFTWWFINNITSYELGALPYLIFFITTLIAYLGLYLGVFWPKIYPYGRVKKN